MARKKKILDSRRCQRYQVENGVIVLDSVFGELIDISFGGLSFRYESYEDMVQKPVEFGIIFGDETLYFDNIPLEKITDFEIEEEVENNGGTVRRRCMQFGQLNYEDLSKIARFISRHTNKKV